MCLLVYPPKSYGLFGQANRKKLLLAKLCSLELLWIHQAPELGSQGLSLCPPLRIWKLRPGGDFWDFVRLWKKFVSEPDSMLLSLWGPDRENFQFIPHSTVALFRYFSLWKLVKQEWRLSCFWFGSFDSISPCRCVPRTDFAVLSELCHTTSPIEGNRTFWKGGEKMKEVKRYHELVPRCRVGLGDRK